ncbi:MAG TPA: PAS domain-containing protein, partial [Sphingomicrobium sp.]|nr:PAS domain-containing protein [Sphingomicrobium sp.]
MNPLDFPSIVNSFHSASNDMLAAILDQSADCIKVIGPTGSVDFMNRNGRCAMEIDDFASVAGKDWWDLWPAEAQPLIKAAIATAQSGKHSRFEAFCPTAKGDPRWWDVSVAPLVDENGTLKGLISISRDISGDMVARELRESTAAEMRHRLQNAYALTSAIVIATARGNAEREAFAREIVERLGRLGIAQSLLLDGGAIGTATLDQLVRRLTEPFCGDDAALEIAPLPEVELDERQVRTLALVLGEFSTNSNKYGALGHGGRIAIDGSLDKGVMTLNWRETTERPVDSAQRDGSTGLTLIRRMLDVHGGTLEISWRADGLDIQVTLPGF